MRGSMIWRMDAKCISVEGDGVVDAGDREGEGNEVDNVGGSVKRRRARGRKGGEESRAS